MSSDFTIPDYQAIFEATFADQSGTNTIPNPDLCKCLESTIMPNDCDSAWLEQMIDEYFCIRGFPVTIYLVTKFSPIYVFGEDPSKSYGASFTTKAIWEVSPENKNYGKFEKTSEEPLQLFLSISLVKKQIKQALLDVGIFSPLTANLPDTEVTKEEAWRRELQEQDILKTDFNNIHYELDSVKKEPEFVYWLNKYVYWVTGRPRLVAGEDLGNMQPVTDSEIIRQEHDMEIQIEAEKILF